MLCCVPGCCAAPRCCAVFHPALCCCALCFFVWLCLVPLLAVSCPFAVVRHLVSCAFRRCVLGRFSALRALCFVCFALLCWCVLLFAAVLGAVCVLLCPAVCSLSSPLCAVKCCTVLVHLRRAVCFVGAVAASRYSGALQCVVLFPLGFCGGMPRCAVGCVLCWAAARCALSWCGLLCCAGTFCVGVHAWCGFLLRPFPPFVPCSPVLCPVVLCFPVVL